MEDIYADLIGPPPDAARQRAIAEFLRKRAQMGSLGAISGDRVLAPVGQGMMKQADSYATELQGNRQDQMRQDQTRRYQDAQLAHMGNVLKETIRNNNLDYDAAMANVGADYFKASQGGRGKNLTLGDRNKLEKMANGYQNMLDTVAGFKDEYTQKLGPGPQSSLPNTLSSFGIGTKGSKEASDWWANWRMIYTLGERNQLFGATLTPAELQAWKENEITPNMDAKQVRSRMQVLSKILERRAGVMGRTYGQQFDPEVIATYGLPEVGDVPPVGDDSGTTSVTSSSRSKQPMSLEEIDARIRALSEQIEGMP